MEETRRKIAGEAKKVVIKVGSAVLAGEPFIHDRLAAEVRALKARGREAVVVSSGAIATGMKQLGMKRRPATIPERQAVAAAGQSSLMALYDAAFSRVDEKTAQVLLTHDDLSDRKRFLNARNTLSTLLRLGIVPIINENDTVAVEELKFGDNDALSALVTNLIEADLLIILTDTDGLYETDPRKDPDARRIPCIEDVDAMDMCALSGSAGSLGTGGIRTKVEAARKAAHFGSATVIADGFTPGVVGHVLDGKDTGTLFLPKEDRLTSRKHWIAFSARPSGRVVVDSGARDALLNRGKSLLPSGIKAVDGDFETGEVVHCVGEDGMEFARGLTNYSSAEVGLIKGHKSGEIERVLGYKVYDEVIHRDNLVVI